MASPRLTGNRVRCIEVPQREGPVPRGRWTELLRPLLIARLNRPAQHNELFGLICEYLAQPAHRLIPDVDPEAFGIFFSASEPTASRWDALRLCDCLRRAHAPQEMEAFKKRQGVDHGVAHFDRTILQSFHQGTLERCHRGIHDCLLPRALHEMTVTVMTIPTAQDSYRRAAECHRGVTMRTGIQQSAVVVETHRGECQPPTSAKIRHDVVGETTATELESVGRSHPIQ